MLQLICQQHQRSYNISYQSQLYRTFSSQMLAENMLEFVLKLVQYFQIDVNKNVFYPFHLAVQLSTQRNVNARALKMRLILQALTFVQLHVYSEKTYQVQTLQLICQQQQRSCNISYWSQLYITFSSQMLAENMLECLSPNQSNVFKQI